MGGGARRTMKNEKIIKTGKNSKGFYTALGLCLLAVGVAAWATFDSVNNFTVDEDPSPIIETEEVISGIKVPILSFPESESSQVSESSEKEVSSEISEASSAPEEERSEVPVVQNEVSSQKEPESSEVRIPTPDMLQYPLGNSVSVPWSGNELVFSETMQDWRAHTGVDIAGEENCEVKACAAGKVKSVTEEGLYGLTVVVSHGELDVSYCGLGTVSVKKNDMLRIGETIGTLGVVPCEEKDISEAHLHLEVSRAGKRIDPAELLG